MLLPKKEGEKSNGNGSPGSKPILYQATGKLHVRDTGFWLKATLHATSQNYYLAFTAQEAEADVFIIKDGNASSSGGSGSVYRFGSFKNVSAESSRAVLVHKSTGLYVSYIGLPKVACDGRQVQRMGLSPEPPDTVFRDVDTKSDKTSLTENLTFAFTGSGGLYTNILRACSVGVDSALVWTDTKKGNVVYFNFKQLTAGKKKKLSTTWLVIIIVASVLVFLFIVAKIA